MVFVCLPHLKKLLFLLLLVIAVVNKLKDPTFYYVMGLFFITIICLLVLSNHFSKNPNTQNKKEICEWRWIDCRQMSSATLTTNWKRIDEQQQQCIIINKRKIYSKQHNIQHLLKSISLHIQAARKVMYNV